MIRRQPALILATTCLCLLCLLCFTTAALASGARSSDRNDRPPVVLLFHAGGWVFGDGSAIDALNPAFRQAGFKPVAVDYTLGSLPSSFADAESAAKRFRHRETYAYGESAGGTLAGWLAGRHLVDAAATNSAVVNIQAFLRPYLNSTDTITLPNGDEVTVGEMTLEIAGGKPFIRSHTLQRIHGEPLRLFGNCGDPVVPCNTSRAYADRFKSVTWRRAGDGHIADRLSTARRAARWFSGISDR
jgi:hypothetical protein